MHFEAMYVHALAMMYIFVVTFFSILQYKTIYTSGHFI